MRERLWLDRHLDGNLWHHRATVHNRASHRHTELELNLVTHGTACYLFGRQRIDLRPGTLVWMFPAQEHLLVDESRDFQMWIAVFRPRMIRRACESPATRELHKLDPGVVHHRTLPATEAKQMERLCTQAVPLRRDPSAFNAAVTWLMLLGWTLHKAATPDIDPRAVHPAVATAAKLIRDEAEVPKIEELAEQCGLSPSRLSRLFKQQMGLPLVRYRQRQCLDRFFRIYDEADASQNLLHAALEAGFGSYAQFFRVYRDLTGRSPADRKREVIHQNTSPAGGGR